MNSENLVSSLQTEIEVIKEIIISGKLKADPSTLARLQGAVFSAIPLISNLKEEIAAIFSPENNTGEKVGSTLSVVGDIVSGISELFPTRTKEEKEEAKEERKEQREERKATRRAKKSLESST